MTGEYIFYITPVTSNVSVTIKTLSYINYFHRFYTGSGYHLVKHFEIILHKHVWENYKQNIESTF